MYVQNLERNKLQGPQAQENTKFEPKVGLSLPNFIFSAF